MLYFMRKRCTCFFALVKVIAKVSEYRSLNILKAGSFSERSAGDPRSEKIEESLDEEEDNRKNSDQVITRNETEKLAIRDLLSNAYN